jgi:hypothetical protein
MYVSYIALTDGSEPMISNLGALTAAKSTPLQHNANNPSSAVKTEARIWQFISLPSQSLVNTYL